MRSETLIQFRPNQNLVKRRHDECPAPLLHKGQKLRLNLFGRTFKILAGDDEASTVVKEIKPVENGANAQNGNREFIIQINEESNDSSEGGSVSDGLDSDEQEDVSISSDEEDSISLDVSSFAKETNLDSDFKDDIPKFMISKNIKRHVKKQISMMFLFENEAGKLKEFKNVDPSIQETQVKVDQKKDLEIPKVEKHRTQRNLLLQSMRQSKRFIEVVKEEEYKNES